MRGGDGCDVYINVEMARPLAVYLNNQIPTKHISPCRSKSSFVRPTRHPTQTNTHHDETETCEKLTTIL